MNEHEDHRPVGRPRSEEADKRILDAACRLLVTAGYDGLHFEHVAALAEVGKATIYRRWPSKEHLAEALLEKYASPSIVVPDTGSIRTDLSAIAMGTIKSLTETEYGPVISALLSQIAGNADLGEMFRSTVVAARRDQVGTVIARAVTRGEIRTFPDRAAADLLVGPIFYRLIFGGSLDQQFADLLVDTLLSGLAISPTQSI